MAECELCDMDLSYCEHGLAQRRQSVSADARLLLILYVPRIPSMALTSRVAVPGIRS